ncbi:MAG: hypothetical protein RMM17_05255 [Acidobacteriota bacterium]|nr:hypothetical protein [Blastocatellia bacterium]MDW8412071.1 hypothetical protein [Acidobacteriota bacterium]
MSRPLTKIAPVIRLLFFILMISYSALAQQRPLLTEDVDIIEPGMVRAQIGSEFLQDQHYALSGLKGDLTRLGIIDLAFGLAPNVQFEVEGTIRDFLSINSRSKALIPLDIPPDAVNASDVGDFTLATKIKLRNESRRFPAVGFRFGVQLPNTNQARGLGTNSMNFFATALLGKRLFSNRLNIFANLGLGILDAPLERFSQNDVLLYGLAGIFKLNNRINLVGEVHGRYSTRVAAAGTEDIAQARLGMQLFAAGLRFDLAGVKGLTNFSPRSGIVLGLTKDIKAFTPVR